MSAPLRLSTAHRPGLPRLAGSRGQALVEFALVIPFILFLILVTIDFGHLIQTRLILTNVAREAGSIGSRQSPIEAAITDLMLASSRPLDLAGADGKVIVTRIDAGANALAPDPAISNQFERGGLGVASGVGGGFRNLGLTPQLHDRLVWREANGTADIAHVTVVETFFKYRPITPLPNFIPGFLVEDGGGLIIRSRAVF